MLVRKSKISGGSPLFDQIDSFTNGDDPSKKVYPTISQKYQMMRDLDKNRVGGRDGG